MAATRSSSATLAIAEVDAKPQRIRQREIELCNGLKFSQRLIAIDSFFQN